MTKQGLQIRTTMVPAVEATLAQSKTGSIGLVPAVKVTLKVGAAVVTSVAVIDTGAEMSMVDESVFEGFGDQKPTSADKLLQVGFSGKRLAVYYVDIEMTGEERQQSLSFSGVPIAVGSLGRPIMIVGRRGVLEWLRVEMDFPKKSLTLIMPEKTSESYPSLAAELPNFPSVLDRIDSGNYTESIMMLVWDLERWLDHIISEHPDIRSLLKDKPLSRRTIGEKLALIISARKLKGLSEAVNELVHTRNEAVHGMVFSKPNRQYVTGFLQNAEQVVGALAELRRVAKHTQQGAEGDAVNRAP
jgi:hypothetical protein